MRCRKYNRNVIRVTLCTMRLRTGQLRTLYNGKFHDLYSLPRILRTVGTELGRWTQEMLIESLERKPIRKR
jgi:hypothetical protein